MPSWSELAYVGLLWSVFSLCGYAITFVVKTPLRLVWKRKAQLKGDSLVLYTWVIRTIPVVGCGGVGLMMGAWPSYVSPLWGVILGSTSGLFSVGIYHGVKKIIPKLLGVLPEALKKRLGG